MVPLDAPIFMLPLAGMMFLLGAVVHQAAGRCFEDGSGPAWLAGSVVGLALQVGAVVILIST